MSGRVCLHDLEPLEPRCIEDAGTQCLKVNLLHAISLALKISVQLSNVGYKFSSQK